PADVARANDRAAAAVASLAGLGELHVAARVGSKGADHRAGAQSLDHVAGDQQRGLAARDGRGGDDDIGLCDVLADELPLLAQELFGLLTRVTSLAYLGFERELDERCAERLDLFLDRGTDVIRRDDRAKAPRGGDRLDAGTARAHAQHAGRRDRP